MPEILTQEYSPFMVREPGEDTACSVVGFM